MSDIILHHYAGSLFSEKIRLLLGYLKLPWKSVVTAPIMPRPLLMPLTGGYRRTPNMQQGADVWCDTKIIAERLAEIAGDTELHAGFVPLRVAEWADSHLFSVVVAVTFQPRAVSATMSTLSSTQVEAFMKDRAELTKGAPIVTIRARRSRSSSCTLSRRARRRDSKRRFCSDPSRRSRTSPCITACGWLPTIHYGAVAGRVSERHCVARPDGGVRARQRHRDHRGRGAGRGHRSAPMPIPKAKSQVPAGFALGQQASVVPTDYGMGFR